MPYRKVAGLTVSELDEFFEDYDSDPHFETYEEVDPERFKHAFEDDKERKVWCRSYEWKDEINAEVDLANSFGRYTDYLVDVKVPIDRKMSVCKTKRTKANVVDQMDFVVPTYSENEAPNHPFHKLIFSPDYGDDQPKYDYENAGFPEHGKTFGYQMKVKETFGISEGDPLDSIERRMNRTEERLRKDLKSHNLLYLAYPKEERDAFIDEVN
jgi:hypothetical protein